MEENDIIMVLPLLISSCMLILYASPLHRLSWDKQSMRCRIHRRSRDKQYVFTGLIIIIILATNDDEDEEEGGGG